MSRTQDKTLVGVEIGKKRTFASALDWPGWCRSGKDEESALQAMVSYVPRYQSAIQNGGLDVPAPGVISEFDVIERQPGGSAIDFGVPEVIFSYDRQTPGDQEQQRLRVILQACWQAFDIAVREAEGKELRKGPRGGGRELEAIAEHVLNADLAYLSRLGWKPKIEPGISMQEAFDQSRREILEALEAAGRGELPERGPRGGKIWPVRYYFRRSAWHILDHVWEIEDRS